MGTTADKLQKLIDNKQLIVDSVNAKAGTSYDIHSKPSDIAETIANIQSGSGEDMLQARVDATNSCSYLLYGYTGTNADFISGLDTSNVTNMNSMFRNCSSLTSVPQLDTSNITNMSYMFSECTNLTSIPPLNTSSVTDMGGMFSSCSRITTIPQLETSKVTKMNSMFNSCSKLTSIPPLNTSSVTDMSSMFSSCSALTTIPQLDTSSVANMSAMFSRCSNLTTVSLNLDTGNVTDMQSMFNSCNNLTTVSFNSDTSKVTNMYCMFYSCKKLTAVQQLDMNNVTNNSSMFYNCAKLNDIILLNIRVNLQVGSGTSYGHLLTVDSLVGLCKECINYNSSTIRKLTVGTANLSKLANVYVKFVDATQTTIATGEKGEVEVCESSDTGAMLISDYMTLKYWQLA